MIPFAPPHIDEKIIEAVNEVLRSGWITTGPKTKLFEKQLTAYCGNKATLCLNSATAGLEIILRWFGVGKGDEVILPAYTYSATANVVIHTGAKPVFVDVNKDDFNISVDEVRKAVNKNTKVIMPVDFGGYPCNYDELNKIAEESRKMFVPNTGNVNQQLLGRVLILSDAAHSLGATYKGKLTGSLTDISVFSFHAVKNLTTAEGGAVALNLPEPFNNEEVYKYLCIYTLHGQNKDALAKMQKGNWRYDIIEAGYKCNMTDINAAIGIVELSRYQQILNKRKMVCEKYADAFSSGRHFEVPVMEVAGESVSSYHLFPLRIRGISELQRDAIMQHIFNNDVAVNVHFIPLPMLSFYKNLGYDIKDYPVTYDNYSREISLPVFYDINNDQIERVITSVRQAVEQVLKGVVV